MPGSGFNGIFKAQPFPLWLRAISFSLAFFLCAVVGNILSPHGGTYVSFWLPAGLYVSVLLLHERRDWLWLALAGLPANILFDVLKGNAWHLALIFYGANTLQAALGAWLVQRFVAKRPKLGSVKEFFGFLALAGALATLPGAAIGAGVLHLAGFSADFFQSAKVWWGSCAMAILLFSPLVLVWGQRQDPTMADGSPVKLRKIVEGVFLFGGLIVSTWLIFVMSEGVTTPYKFRTLPFLVWAGLRFGRRGATAANFIYAVMVVYSASFARFAAPTDVAAEEIAFTIQTFLAVAAVVSLVPAITLAERDATLTKLRESEAHYRNLTEAAFEGVCLSENGRIVDVSDQLLGMLGYERSEVVGRQLHEFVTAESRATVLAAVQGERETPYGVQLVRQDGSSFNCESRARIVAIGGRKLRMTALRDITERLKAEEALRFSEEKFSKAFLSSPSAMVITRQSDGLILEANDAFCKRYEVAAATARGRSVFDLGVWQDAAEREALIKRLREEGSIRNFEKATVLPSGRRSVSLLSLEQIRIHGDECLLAVTHDITDLKNAEQALRESEAKFRALFNTANDAIFLMQDLVFIDCNPMTEVMFGCQRGQVIGRTPLDFSPERQPDGESSAPKAEKKVAAVLAGQPQFFEWLHCRLDGSQFNAEVSLNRMDLGGAFYVQAIVRDVTVRKQTEERLRLLSERLKLAAAAATIAVWEWNLQTNEIFVDDRLYEIYGYAVDPSGHFTFAQWAKHVHPEDLPGQETALQKTIAARGQSSREFRIIRTDGELRHIHAAEKVIVSERGVPIWMVGVNLDITERKCAEEALRENQRMLATLLDNLPGLVYRCQNDEHWTMEFVSDGCLALTGYAVPDLLYNRKISFGQMIHPDDRQMVFDRVQQALQQRGVFELNYRIRTAGGQEKWVWERGQGVSAPDGKLLALEGFITDVTAQHQAEAERAAATRREQEARDEFTRQLIASQEAERTRIAREIHDHLGQLLTALKLDLRTIERRASVLSDVDLRNALTGKINSAKELADETITSVQKIASELRPGILDRLGLAAAIEVEAQAFQSRTGVNCRCIVPAELPDLPTDRATAAFRIFQEIVTNVARHAQATEVGIQLAVTPVAIELTVTDNGVGIQAAQFRNPKSLGLLGMRERAEILGGQIEFRRPDGGQGTMVIVQLPLGAAVPPNS